MPTSRITSALSKPVAGSEVPATTFTYFRTRNRMHVFSLVQNEFQQSGITQAELALRLGKGSDRVCRLLGAPGNWTLDTVSDLLFAISGAEVKYDVSHPLDMPPRNRTKPEWCEGNYDRTIAVFASPEVPLSQPGYVTDEMLTAHSGKTIEVNIGHPVAYAMKNVPEQVGQE